MKKVDRIRILGDTGSPYTKKMLAVMRYRQIPYSLIWGTPGPVLDEMGLARPKPLLLPVMVMPQFDGSDVARYDSTPIIRDLEAIYTGRSVLPDDPATAFLDYLIEDFGDEWCTKYMFHYRWHPPESADNAGTRLPLGHNICLDSEEHQRAKEDFARRQIDRLYVVGSNEMTAPVIDRSYRRFLAIMEAHLARQPFILGNRPGAGDFAVYGQLSQLVGFDPTPRAIAHEVSPRTVEWVDLMEDQSGLEPDEEAWNDVSDLPGTLRELLKEIGRVYVPAMLRNAAAVAAGESEWETEIDGTAWSQKTFPYQAKCLRWLNEQYDALDADSRDRVDAALKGTGCGRLIGPNEPDSEESP
ncbi:glutathione S-transferase family protein [Halieaceae bacterium IMCC8485]|jgi:glutathione S-transferase|uniref:Glutathione S-transferase family protein n=1 Tax=Candidatus Seongchinamella marina TaxID=2518990 RepID=A0ABT3T0I6_9GAMM|nr:glutathione S-transferase C-terminal domain-containing protein [Candidatus Seongchinamella marina]MCX2975380.1 glutathione S-transferase family protein [Candidatus Seongchinamella marina]